MSAIQKIVTIPCTDLLFHYVNTVIDHPVAIGDDENTGGRGQDQEGAGVTAVVVFHRGVHGEGRRRETPGSISKRGRVDIATVSEEED